MQFNRHDLFQPLTRLSTGVSSILVPVLVLALCALHEYVGAEPFDDVTVDIGLEDLGRGEAAWADFDNDGDLDLCVAGKLLRNPGNAHHWLKLRLGGPGVNAFAIGAEVRVHVGNWRITHQVEGGTGEGNQNDLTLHFGLGKRVDPVDVEIRWPDGTSQIVRSAVDKTLELTQGKSIRQ